MTFFSPQKDESLASIVCRWTLVTGQERKTYIFSPFINDQTKSIRIFPKANKELAAVLRKIFSCYSTSSFIRHNSLIPLYGLTNFHNLSEYHINDLLEVKKGIGSMSGALDLAEHKSSPVKVCPLCFKDQLVSNGFRWMKREWQLEFSSKCLKHNTPLMNVSCRACNNSSNPIKALFSALSEICCDCGKPISFIPVDLHRNFNSVRMARFLLKKNYLPMSEKLCLYLLRECGVKKGISRNAKYAEIKGFWVREILKDKFIPYDSYKWENKHIYQTHRTFQYRFLKYFCGIHYGRYWEHCAPSSCIYLPLSMAFKSVNKLDELIRSVTDIQPKTSNSKHYVDLLTLKPDFNFLGGNECKQWFQSNIPSHL